MEDNIFVEIDCQQKNHYKERVCGDFFITRKVKEDNRIIAVLSDGMGHGVKANVLSTLTATMAVNFAREHKAPAKIAEIIMKTLPVCSIRKMSYATFTIIEIKIGGEVVILEYENPETIIVRNREIFEPGMEYYTFTTKDGSEKKIVCKKFIPRLGDRIIFCSDGIAQAGLGTPVFPFGWGTDNIGRYVVDIVKQYPDISANNLSSRILNMAYRYDGFQAKDDSSAGVIYFREPRKLLICTGPPYHEEDDGKLAMEVRKFQGKKVIMGATTGDIIARELNLKIEDDLEFTDPELPPLSRMEGVDLYTEGILTLNKVEKILKGYNPSTRLGNGPADRVVKLILESDEIKFIVGTKINIAHQDPSLPVELEIRRTVVQRIGNLLEEKFLKKADISYI